MTRRSAYEHDARRFLIAFLIVIPVVLSDLAVIPSRAADDLAERISAARARQEQLKGSIERQRSLLGELRKDQGIVRNALHTTADQLQGINADQAAVRAEIGDATEALTRVEGRHAALVEEIAQLDWTIDLLEQEIAHGEEDLDARRRILGERLAQAYRIRHTSLLEQVLAADSFADVVTDVDTHLRFGDQDAELAAGIERDRRSLESMRRLIASTRYRTDLLRLEAEDAAAEIRDQRARLQAAKAKLGRLEARTRRIQQQQRDQFARISQDKAATSREIAARQAAEDRLRSSLSALIAEAQRRAEEERRRREAAERRRREAAERAAAQRRADARDRGGNGGSGRSSVRQSTGNGLLDWPTSGVVTQEYGCTGFAWEPPRGSCRHFHDGIDISNGSGTPVRAAGSGVVIFVGYNPYDGYDPAYIVGIAHGNGLESWYAHLLPRRAPGVGSGSRVGKGRVIGYMGNTGRSTGTHLHWELRRGGSPVNPRIYL